MSVLTKMATGRKLTKIGLVLCVISLVLQVLGFTCPGWVVTVIYLHVISAVLGSEISGYGELTTMVAVWYGRVCVDADFRESETCSLATDHDARFYGFRVTTALWPLADIDWTKVRILLTLALFMCCLGVFLAAASLLDKLRISPRLLLASAAAFMLVSGALVIPATLEVGLAIIDAEKATSEENEATGYELVKIMAPWALLLSGIGLVMAFVGAVFLAVASCKEKQGKSMEVTPESSKVLFNIGLDKSKNISDSSFSTDSQGPTQLPRIGEPDTESLVFENAPFRPVQFSSFRAPNTGNGEGQPKSDVSQDNGDEDPSQDKESMDKKQSKSNLLTVGTTTTQAVGKEKGGGSSKVTVGKVQQGKPTEPINTYYNSLVTEGVPGSRHLQNQRKKAQGGTNTRGRKGSHVNVKQGEPPVIVVSPFARTKANGRKQSIAKDEKTMQLTPKDQKVLDINTLYGQKLTHANSKHVQMTKSSDKSRTTERADNVQREASVESW